MTDALAFLVQHGRTVLFLVVLAGQLGLPLPPGPFLLAAGALAGRGRLDLASAWGLSLLAAVLSDLVWYEGGRRKGRALLDLLCRISLEPDSCVRRTENAFLRHGPRTLLVAKFVPGLGTVAPPLAGIIRLPLARFLLYSGAGSLLWVGTYLLLGYVFRDQLQDVARHMLALGGGLGTLLGAALVAWLGVKYAQRRRFLRDLKVARISPQELRSRLAEGEEVLIVDLRGALDFASDPRTIPGALRVSAEELAERHETIPHDREIVLYCT